MVRRIHRHYLSGWCGGGVTDLELDAMHVIFGNRLYGFMLTMTEEERSIIATLIEMGVSSRWIADTLTKHGYPIGKSTINDIRKRWFDARKPV